jgi:hypothetical protein
MTGRGMWGVGVWVLLGVVALAAATFAPVVESAQPDLVRRPPPPSAALRPYPADSLGRLTVSRDVFRSARRPATLAYDPQGAAAPVETNQPPKPALALVGIVVGPEPTAVIEGFPSVEGSRVVRVGDVVSGLRVARIAADRVVITGMDTTWTLKVREPWN